MAGLAIPRGSGQTNTDTFRLSAPRISPPKGGGAIFGIGQKFAANPLTATRSVSVSIVTSPGRQGLNPELAVSHDTRQQSV
jgi:hypothetical protein